LPPFRDVAPSGGSETVVCVDNCDKSKSVLQRLHSAVRFTNASFDDLHYKPKGKRINLPKGKRIGLVLTAWHELATHPLATSAKSWTHIPLSQLDDKLY